MLDSHARPHGPIKLNVSDEQPLVWGYRTYVMGIINVSPDSFSGDGFDSDIAGVIKQGLTFQAEGADILDLGAQSTRPGHLEITEKAELDRLIPALDALVNNVDIPISVDTYKPAVAKAAMESGASIINDIWGLKHDPNIARIAAEHEAPIILMHNQSINDRDCEYITIDEYIDYRRESMVRGWFHKNDSNSNDKYRTVTLNTPPRLPSIPSACPIWQAPAQPGFISLHRENEVYETDRGHGA